MEVSGSQQGLHLHSMWIRRRSRKTSGNHRDDLEEPAGGVSGSQECKTHPTAGLLGKAWVQQNSRTWRLAGVADEVAAMDVKDGQAVVAH